MPLGMQVSLGPDHVVLDGDPVPSHKRGTAAPPQERGTAPNFRPMSVVAERLDELRCHLVRRQASAHATVLHGDQAPPHKKWAQSPFSAMPSVANGRPSQLLQSTYYFLLTNNTLI